MIMSRCSCDLSMLDYWSLMHQDLHAVSHFNGLIVNEVHSGSPEGQSGSQRSTFTDVDRQLPG